MVLVCGLGALGQLCLQRLLAFGLELQAIDQVTPRWREPELEHRLQGCLTIGDMRLPRVLKQAGAPACRAVLLLSSDSSVNIEAALQVRLLNPNARIVVRSGGHQADLGSLLEDRLGGIAVVDPTLLCAQAIVTALRPPSEPLQLEADGETLLLLDAPPSGQGRLKLLRLDGTTAEQKRLYLSPRVLHSSRDDDNQRSAGLSVQRWIQATLLQPVVVRGRRLSQPQRRLGLVLLAMVLFGVVQFAQLSGWKQGIFVMLALLKGEYVDAVSMLLPDPGHLETVSAWMLAGTLVYALLGTLLTSALVAAILERLLRDRLGSGRARLPREPRQPVLLVGHDALTDVVTRRLARQRRTVVRVGGPASSLAHGPAVVVPEIGEALSTLRNTSLSGAGFLSSDLLENLQQALACRRRWPGSRVVVLAHAFGAADQLGDLLGGIAVVSAVDLVADAVMTTAFGERVEGVFRVLEQTLLLVRFQLQGDDTLHGRNIARVEYGYGLTVLSLRRHQSSTPMLLPGPDLVLTPGDTLLVLASATSLRRVELGQSSPPLAALVIRCPAGLSQDRRFDVRQSLARWLACAPGEVDSLLDGASHRTPPLDLEIRDLLCQDLRRLGVSCECLPE